MTNRGDDSVNVVHTVRDGEKIIDCGLTIREHFAAMAMQGLLAGGVVTYPTSHKESVAVFAVEFADALLKELEK